MGGYILAVYSLIAVSFIGFRDLAGGTKLSRGFRAIVLLPTFIYLINVVWTNL